MTGLGFLALGVLSTLANFGVVDLLVSLRALWPSLLIVWGLLELLASFEARSMRGRR